MSVKKSFNEEGMISGKELQSHDVPFIRLYGTKTIESRQIG